MHRVSVTELKNRLSEFLRLVKRGETVEILERSVPIARIARVGQDSESSDSHLEQLIYDGVVTRAGSPADRSLLDEVPTPCRTDAVKTLIEERGER